MFNNQVTGLPQEPPVFPPAMCDRDITALVFGHTLCVTHKNTTADTHKRDGRKIPLRTHCITVLLKLAWAMLIIFPVCSLWLFTITSDNYHHLPSVQQASGSRYSSTTSTTATSSTSGLMSIVLPSDELVSSSWDKQRAKEISSTSHFLSEHYRLSSEMLKAYGYGTVPVQPLH